jgi:hypothetical protein
MAKSVPKRYPKLSPQRSDVPGVTALMEGSDRPMVHN